MAQEYLKEYIRLTRNENLEEPPSVKYNQNPNHEYHRLNALPKMTYEPTLMKAETHRFKTTHQQQQPPPPPPTKINRVVATSVAKPYKPSPAPVVNGYEYENEALYDHEPPDDQEQSSRMYGRDHGSERSRNRHYPPTSASLYGQNYNSATANNNINKNRGRPYAV